MSFLALLLGLGIERMLTHVFQIREFRWLDPVFDFVFSRMSTRQVWVAQAGAAVLAVLLVAPVGLVSVVLADELMNVVFVLFSIFVLLFSLGPRDLKEEVEDYCIAVEAADGEAIRKVAKELLEREPSADLSEQAAEVERAVYLQANNRIFGVVFWFIVLGSVGPFGPAGAWLFRVLDLMRRRLAFQHGRRDDDEPGVLEMAVCGLHGWAAWIPGRLLALGYALAGSFEDAVHDWRGYYEDCAPRFFDITSDIIGCVGQGAAGRGLVPQGDDSMVATRVRAALQLVTRTLWMIWCPVIAILTLYNWLL